MPKRVLRGIAVADARAKTVIVLVERRVQHPLLKKVVRSSKRHMAHDENNVSKKGDTVSICESRPYSKRKTWTVENEA